MKQWLICLMIWSVGLNAQYFPPQNQWEVKQPAQLELKAAWLDSAIAFAKAGESKNPRSMEINHYQTFGKEPFGEGIGPFKDRGDATGLIIYKGYIVAQWGDVQRCDMTHSVTKSFLSTVVGLAVQEKLIKSIDDKVHTYIPPIELYTPTLVQRPAEQIGQPYFLEPFNTPHNQKITWNHLLRQTSDWEGTLWGKPDWADRPDTNPKNWHNRKRNEPGTSYEYNDVRVNALALAATSVWRKSLPVVMKEKIMDKIGASSTWRWAGYRNAWIVLDGQVIQSVSGGGHWGGGLFINALDMARFGLFTLHKGKWNGQQLLNKEWFDLATTPTSVKKDYGFMNYFLNTQKEFLPSAPTNAWAHIGNGTNMIYVDPSNELVVVARWIEHNAMNGFIERVLKALP